MIEINHEKPKVVDVITYQSLSITITVDEKDIEIIISYDDTDEINIQVVTQVQVTGDATGFSDYDGYLETIYEELSKGGEKIKEEIEKICDEIEIEVEKILEEYNINV